MLKSRHDAKHRSDEIMLARLKSFLNAAPGFALSRPSHDSRRVPGPAGGGYRCAVSTDFTAPDHIAGLR